MAKIPEEINELLSKGIYKKAVEDKIICVNDDGFEIQYNCCNKTRRRLQNPKECVQSEVFIKLVNEYEFPQENISLNESVQIGSDTREADILVYKKTNQNNFRKKGILCWKR